MGTFLDIAADELIVDNFAGGGGASTAIELALGRPIDIAINHDPEAIAMHMANHPRTKHLCESVWTVDIRKEVAGRKVGLAWFSPDCKHFSKAKGGKPVEKGIRGLAWVVLKWAQLVKPRVIMLENVEEFRDWGPVVDGQPCKLRKGQTFKSWCTQLRNAGYEIDHRELKACDYGAPTIRKRLFLIARCDGRPIRWPAATNTAEGDLFRAAYRTAAECIDWSIPCHSIFLTREEGRKVGVNRPLAEKTMARIARGVKKYVLDSVKPFIVNITHTGGDRTESIDDPLKTITGAHRGEKAVVSPVLVGVGGRAGQSRPRSADEPIATVTAKADTVLVAPYLTRTAHGDVDRNGKKRGRAEHSLEEALPTTTSSPDLALVAPILVGAGGSEYAGKPRTADAPLNALTAHNRSALVSTFLSSYYGDKRETDVRGADLGEQVPTIPTENRHALVSAYITQHNAGPNNDGLTGRDAEEPLSTITSRGTQQNVVAALLSRQFGSSIGSGVDEPAGTTTAGGGGKTALVTSHISKMRGTNTGHAAEEPLHTISADGTHHAEVRAFLLKYFGTEQNPQLEEPLHTITSKHRFGLVTVMGELYEIVDIGMRMLTPRELFLAQGFPRDYIIDHGVDPETGKRVKLTKTAQVRMCGNSVSPPPAEAIVRANFERPEKARRVA